MTPALFLVDRLPSDDHVVLDGDEGRHAARVKRLTLGERILVGDGSGTIASCTVTAVGRDRVEATVHSRTTQPAPDPQLVVVQALPKGDRGDLAVELLTEMGADEVVPWAACRSVAQWRGERGARALERWRRVARESTKQSRRPWVCRVSGLASTAEVATRLGEATVGFVLHEAASAPIVSVDLPVRGTVVVVVGPEGGISDEELAAFGPSRAVRLGTPVLRTSTAGAAAVAVLSGRLGRWG